MAAIAKADFEAISDSLGIQYTTLLSLAETTEADDLVAAATGNLGRIDDLADIDAQVQLLDAFNALKKACANPFTPVNTLFSTAVQRLLGNTGQINTYLTGVSGYVSKAFRDLLAALSITVNPQYVMPESVVSLATFNITGSGTGTFGASSSIDRTIYAATPCEIKITTDIGNATTVHLTMQKQDGTTEVIDYTFDGSEAADDVFDITGGAGKWCDCTAITVIAGSNSGAFIVQNKLIRTPAA